MYLIYDSKLYNDDAKFISPFNRSFIYGEGVFETMFVNNGQIALKQFHFERLSRGLQLLQMQPLPGFDEIEEQIKIVLKKNNHNDTARVRLTAFRKNDETCADNSSYIIQSFHVPERVYHATGIRLGLYDQAKKSCDQLSNVKSNNYLLYALAARYAKQNELDDCTIYNSNDNICETSIANIFVIKDQVIYTPALSEGCIAGVMRRKIIEHFTDITIIEKGISLEELQNADEIFISNAIKGIQPIGSFQDIKYPNILISQLYKELFE
ncbi:aminodeoxychorismate lyase [soil metagenome]